MADPKLAAGGAAIAILGGGTGVGVQRATDGMGKYVAIRKEKIELMIEKAGFTINKESPECQEGLKKEGDIDNYKTAVLKCAKEKTFEDIITFLKLQPLDITQIEAQSSAGDGNTKGTNKKDDIKKLESNTETSNAGTSISNAKSKLEQICKPNQEITKDLSNEKGHQFLNICVKEDGSNANDKKPLKEALKKDFGTGGLTIKARFENLGFEPLAAEKACTDKLTSLKSSEDLKGILDVCYKNKKFSNRATSLGLKVLTSNNLSEDGGEAIGTANKDLVKTEVTGDNGNDAKNNLQTYCTTESKGNKTIDKNTINDEGKKFIKVCTKDKSDLKGRKTKVEFRGFGSIAEY